MLIDVVLACAPLWWWRRFSLLRHLPGPFFKWRLAFLDDRERHRVARAEKSGDVYRAAWLTKHYRSERGRLARHWSHLSTANADKLPRRVELPGEFASAQR